MSQSKGFAALKRERERANTHPIGITAGADSCESISNATNDMIIPFISFSLTDIDFIIGAVCMITVKHFDEFHARRSKRLLRFDHEQFRSFNHAQIIDTSQNSIL